MTTPRHGRGHGPRFPRLLRAGPTSLYLCSCDRKFGYSHDTFQYKLQRISPYVSALLIFRIFLYMCKSLTYVLTKVTKHNVDVFSTRTYFWRVCELNSSGVILKCLAMHDRFLQKDFRTKRFHLFN